MYVSLGASQLVRMLNNLPVEDSVSLAVSGASACCLPPANHDLWLRSILKTQILKRLSRNEALDKDRDILIILAGTNDISLAEVDVPSLEKALKALLLYAERHFRFIVVGRIPPIPLFPAHVNHKIDVVNQWLSSFCSRESLRDRVLVVDSFSPFMRQDSWEPDRRFYEKYYFPKRGHQNLRVDLLHLNREGLRILHRLLLEAAERFTT